MSEIVETRYNSENKQTLKIIYDEDAQNPRTEFDTLCTILSSRDELGDVHIRNREELEQWKSDNPIVLEFPLYAYEHGDISLSMSDSYPYNDRWDAGQIGVIAITKKDMKNIMEYSNLNKKRIETLTSIAKSEIETYNDYLNGNVYGFEIVKTVICDLECEHEESLDSCWGFYGHDFEKNGISDYVPDFEKYV